MNRLSPADQRIAAFLWPETSKPESRQARRSVYGEPLSMTPREIAADEMLSLENLHRYRAQSANTVAGKRAEVPARGRISLGL